jgi:hypothetical protein
LAIRQVSHADTWPKNYLRLGSGRIRYGKSDCRTDDQKILPGTNRTSLSVIDSFNRRLQSTCVEEKLFNRGHISLDLSITLNPTNLHVNKLSISTIPPASAS